MDAESEKEGADHELIELLNELRVALPGVQVLFAFLLAVPFQQRFQQATPFERADYFFTLSCTFVASALLIAPSALHRVNFRIADKRTIVLVSNGLSIAGIGVLAVALVGVMVLIAHALFSPAAAIVAGCVSGVLLGVLWVVIPLRERHEAKAGRRELS
jgi:hypothetical protein